MRYIFLFMVPLLWFSSLHGKNPIDSPTFADIIKDTIGAEKYIFDKNILIKTPNFADNPVQVPIYIDGKKITGAKRMIVFADLNPIPVLVDMELDNMLPVISMNIKVAQETPLRALIQDKNNLWHIGSANIKSFGGGCAVSSNASSDTNYEKYLGKTKGSIFVNRDAVRIKSSIFHPMETGLLFGTTEFYINKIVVKGDEKILSTIETFSAISENPRFLFETLTSVKNYSVEFYDIDGNEFVLDL